MARLGGNSDNDGNCGFYCNLNNAASNTNWSIAAAQSYEQRIYNVLYFPYLLVKFIPMPATVSS